jgi:NhaA family Na+:H+ antiporter
MAAALGGMVVPALLFTAFNVGGSGAGGWGIPMATDIAFALGILALLGDRVPVALKVFLAALAIVDDIGAVLVIAVFYTADLAWVALFAAAALLLVSAGANAAGVRSPWAYALIGLALWAAVLVSGVHATVAGVLLAMTIPARTRIDEAEFLERARAAIGDFDNAHQPDATLLTNHEHQAALHELELLADHAQAPLTRLEHSLGGLVAFGIMPLFALANAGVPLALGDLGRDITSPVTLGVLVGLVLGKPIGITLFSWAAVRSGIAALPTGVSWRTVHGAAWLGGIGFTMSLFIAGLAFADSPALLTEAKLGILGGSLLAGFVGWTLLRRGGKRQV